MLTSRRPPSGLGSIPGTAMTGQRGSLRSGISNTGGIGVGLTTNVEVSERPITRQGMLVAGPKTGQGPKRQVHDKSYYLGELRAKISEITLERDRLKEESEKLHQDNTHAQQLQQRQKNLNDEIVALQNQLKDYNIAVSKLQEFQGEDGIHEKIEKLANVMKSSNEKKKAENNRIFTVRKEKEDVILDLENKVKKMNEAVINKQNMHKLREKEKLEEMRNQLKNEIDELSLEQSDSLVQKVKDDTSAIKTLTAELQGTRQKTEQVFSEIEQLRNQIKNFDSPLVQRFKELKKKAGDLASLTKNFDQDRTKYLKELSEQQELVVTLLDHISSDIHAQENLPSKEDYEDMAANLLHKEEEKVKSETTLERLEKELELRKKELGKMENIEGKMKDDIKMLDEKHKLMISELLVYNDIQSLKGGHEKRMKEMSEEKTYNIKLRDSMKQLLHMLTRKVDQTKKLLSRNEIHTMLSEYEQKIRVYEQSIFTLQEYIDQKGSETDYEPVKADCISLSEELNKLINKSISL